MTLDMVDPKRISGRFEFRIEFSGFVQRYGKEVSFRGWSRDLSESGMGAYIPVELREGEQVNLDLTLEAGAPKLRVAAKVRRSQGFEYGFEFVTLSAMQRAAITSAVAHCGDAPLPLKARTKPSQLFAKALRPLDTSAEPLRYAPAAACLW